MVLIDAPGHAEFLRNMITGASQADAAVLIIDALEGVRDQTRRHGYLLHLLGVKQVAVVVNKMDRVDFSAARFAAISDEISAHLDRPRRQADRDHSDFRARRRRRCRAHAETSAGMTARPWSKRSMRWSRRGRWSNWRCGCRCRRSTNSTTAASSPAASNPASLVAGDEIVIMPAGKIARIKSVESWPLDAADGAAERGQFGRHHARPRIVHRTRRRDRPYAAEARATRAGFARGFSGCTTTRCATGASILVRLGTREARATVVAIENAVDPGELAASRHRRDRAQPCRRDRYLAGAADGGRSLCRQSAHRAAGDRGQWPHCRRRPGAVGRCRSARRACRYRAGGIGTCAPTNARRAIATAARWSG